MLIDEWEIDVEKLPGPKRGQFPVLYFSDELFVAPSGNVAALIYTISEVAMGWNIGLFALFENKSNPDCILNPNDFRCFATEDTVIWLSNQLFLVKKYFYDRRENKIEIPFVVVDIIKERFSFLPVKNSIPYSAIVEEKGLRLKENYRDDNFPSENNRLFLFEELSWRPNRELFQFDDFYYASLT